MEAKAIRDLQECYKKILKEDFFDSYDHEERDDSWYYEDQVAAQQQALPPKPQDDKQVADYNKSMSPEHFADKPFNAYECCNRILLSCENRLEVIELFCKLIDHLACDCEDNQALVKDFVSRL